MESTVHVSVLRDEAVSMLRAEQGGNFLDCTFGGGGHAAALLEAGPEVTVAAVDRDPRAIERSALLLGAYPQRLKLKHGPFSAISDLYPGTRFDGVLADLGVSTDQLREERGFSFGDKTPLDMRMDTTCGESAAELIERVSPQELYQILRQGGVGPEARSIVSLILRNRPFATARELADCLKDLPLLKAKKKRVHPATVVFQALRIAVNNEFGEIEALLKQSPALIRPGGRLAVITFHSLEDRLVTHRMREWENQGTAPASYPGARSQRSIGKVITRKPIIPSDQEIERNPASRSAQLRVFEFAQ